MLTTSALSPPTALTNHVRTRRAKRQPADGILTRLQIQELIATARTYPHTD